MASSKYRCTRGHLVDFNVNEADPQDWPQRDKAPTVFQDVWPLGGRIFCALCLRDWAEQNNIGFIAWPPEASA